MDDDNSALGSWGEPQGQQDFFISWWLNVGLKNSSFQPQAAWPPWFLCPDFSSSSLSPPSFCFLLRLSLWCNLQTIRCTRFQVYDSKIFNKCCATITIQFQHLLITHLQSLVVPFWQWEAWVILSHYLLGELIPKERAQREFIQIKKLYLNEVAATKTLLSPKTPAPITALALVHKSPQQEEVW